jgi:hypothetical protein
MIVGKKVESRLVLQEWAARIGKSPRFHLGPICEQSWVCKMVFEQRFGRIYLKMQR